MQREPWLRGEASYNIIIEFSLTIKLVRTINIYLKENYDQIPMDGHLFDTFPTQNDLKPLRLNFALEWAARKV
jgi:hypothetical protein